MASYSFVAGERTHVVGLSARDSAILTRHYFLIFPPWRAGIFAAHLAGEVVSLPRLDAIQDAHLLLDTLIREEALLGADYSAYVSGRAGPSRLSARFDCVVNQGAGSLITGPGTAHIIAAHYEDFDEAKILSLLGSGELRPAEAARLRRDFPSLFVRKKIADLRGVSSFETKDGQQINIRTAHAPTGLVAAVRDLVSFIDGCRCDAINVEYRGEVIPW